MPQTETSTARLSTDQPTLLVSELRKSFGERVAVDGVSFQIAAGETYGLLGPNGAGKTTAISMIAGLLGADEGSVSVVGERMGPHAIAPKRHIGLVPQEMAIYPDISARDNLRYFGRLQRITGAHLRKRVDEILDLVGLADRAKGAVKEFSGGMQRRLNIGIGLLHRPRLLILDEPTVGVDPQSRNAILESVEALAGEGMAVLYTTHYMEEAERLCDRIAIIDSGRFQAEGTRDELITLTGGVDHIDLRGTGELAAAAGALRDLERVSRVEQDSGGLRLTVRDAPAAIAQIVTEATSAGMRLADVQVSRPNLEAVFLHLTGKALRD
ncbi:ABC transporter ATP-binding protein [Cumulibacter soli]|uniref:ABC transporter ATP-binding protein n=1 Tax=Cumulibacter soli TaxID=2546344 RepID=UPI001067ACF3|nr:ABC transporter ATP-binding protein [Cumulibacter soli]